MPILTAKTLPEVALSSRTINALNIPISLYIHLPWCVRKCPYCDFNSHAAKGDLPESLYIDALLHELAMHLARIPNLNLRTIRSIFFGGGTPSLFSADSIAQILHGVSEQLKLDPRAEITLEANPGTIDQHSFKGFFEAGVNRISLGIQSFQNDKLKSLGRIHDGDNARKAIYAVKDAGFTNFNIDIMHGLPNQSVADALYDIETALSFSPTHFSWYQLTIEPNTLFHYQTPQLPSEEIISDILDTGYAAIKQAGFAQYEVSAYARDHQVCRHNLNYWQFGDYLGIGAGAHSKITQANGEIIRFSQVKNPRDYLLSNKRDQIQYTKINNKSISFEFMLNALRLTDGVSLELFKERTGIEYTDISDILNAAKKRGLLIDVHDRLCATSLGKKFLNDVVALFL